MSKSIRSQSLPWRSPMVGSVVKIGDGEYLVVRKAGVDRPSQACRGCSFRGGTCPAGYACSSYDRVDGVGVWYVRVDSIDYLRYESEQKG